MKKAINLAFKAVAFILFLYLMVAVFSVTHSYGGGYKYHTPDRRDGDYYGYRHHRHDEGSYHDYMEEIRARKRFQRKWDREQKDFWDKYGTDSQTERREHRYYDSQFDYDSLAPTEEKSYPIRVRD